MILTDLTGKEVKIEKCLGCEVANGSLDVFGGILWEDEDFIVTQDFEVPINGFIIISTKRHLSSINDFTEKEKTNFVLLLDKVLRVLKETGVAKEFILLQGERSDIHFHMSLFPRQKWMSEKFGRVVSCMKQIQEYAKQNMRTQENLGKIKQTCDQVRKGLK